MNKRDKRLFFLTPTFSVLEARFKLISKSFMNLKFHGNCLLERWIISRQSSWKRLDHSVDFTMAGLSHQSSFTSFMPPRDLEAIERHPCKAERTRGTSNIKTRQAKYEDVVIPCKSTSLGSNFTETPRVHACCLVYEYSSHRVASSCRSLRRRQDNGSFAQGAESPKAYVRTQAMRIRLTLIDMDVERPYYLSMKRRQGLLRSKSCCAGLTTGYSAPGSDAVIKRKRQDCDSRYLVPVLSR